MSSNTGIVRLRVRRGPEATMPTLSQGEPGYTTDTKKLFIGDGMENHQLAKQADLDTTNTQLGLKANQADLAATNTRLDATNTQVGLKADKAYVDTQVGLKADKTYVDTQVGSKANQTDVSAINTQVGLKADKTYVDQQLANVSSGGTIDLTSKADKSYVDDQLATKANQSDLSTTNTQVGLKADKTYVDTQLGLKSDKTYVDTQVGLKSDKTYVDTQLGLKSDKTYVDTQLGLKSDKTYVDTQLGLKASQTALNATNSTVSALSTTVSSKTTVFQQDTPPANATEGTLWLDTSDNAFQGTVFEALDTTVSDINATVNDITVSVKEYSSYALNVGQANEDWTPALLRAWQDYNKVRFPRGTYRMGVVSIDPTLSGKEMHGDGDSTIINPFNGNLFSVAGTVGSDINISANITDFSNSITVTSATGISAGDYILLKGQRDCLNETDSGEAWTLGYATPSAQGLFFGEYLEVDSVVGNVITTKTRTIFPSYRTDKTLEVSVNARACTTVTETTFVKDLVFKDFKVNKTSGYAFYFNRAYNCVVDNVTMIGDGYQNSNYIAHTFFNNSLNCQGKNLRFVINHDINPTNYFDVNVYKCVGSTNCGFYKCYAKNTGQNVDFSYNAGGTPTINCYLSFCTFENPTQSGFTSHGGTYQCLWLGNTVRGARQGFSCRTRNSVIANNVFIGYTDPSPNDLHYGIGLYEGYAVDCIIEGNTIVGFYTGIGVFDATDLGECFKYCGAIVKGNTIKNFKYGFRVYKNTSQKQFKEMGIKLIGNTMLSSNMVNSICVQLDQYTRGVTVAYNNLTGSTSTSSPTGRAIWADYDVSNIKAIGNTFRNCAVGIYLRGNSDTATTGGALTWDRFMNEYQNVTTNQTIGTGYSLLGREQ